MSGLDTFVAAYVACALWSSLDEHGDPLDGSGADVAPETLVNMRIECEAFYSAHAALWAHIDAYSDEQAGHDFWLTRNRHGAGFWDRGIGPVGQTLTDCAHLEGSRDLYIGDDGLIYQG
jgi:hypothetical protein